MIGAGEIFGLLAALAWATTGLLVRAHGAGMHAVVINALRCSIASVAFVLAWPFVSHLAPIAATAWVLLVVSMIAGLGIGDSLYFEALKRIGVARAMPISMAYPVLAALGGAVLLDERLGVLAIAGIALTLGGVYLVALPTTRIESSNADWRGITMAIVAAVCWSASTLLLRPVLSQIDVPTASAIRMPLASGLLWLTAFRAGVLPERQHVFGQALLPILVTGVTTIGATVFSWRASRWRAPAEPPS